MHAEKEAGLQQESLAMRASVFQPAERPEILIGILIDSRAVVHAKKSAHEKRTIPRKM